MGELRRRHTHLPESKSRTFVRSYRFEIVWLLLGVVGLVLLLDRWNIRRGATRWLSQAAGALGTQLAQVDQAVARFIARTTWLNALGFILVAIALIAMALRVRWRLMHAPQLTLIRCPRCGGEIHRMHRRFTDRLTGWLVPTRRYRCAKAECHWEGLRVTIGGHGVGSRRS